MIKGDLDVGELLDDGALTVPEAVAWSGVGRTRLYVEMAEGRLPFVQKGARRLIPRRALKMFLAADLSRPRAEASDASDGADHGGQSSARTEKG